MLVRMKSPLFACTLLLCAAPVFARSSNPSSQSNPAAPAQDSPLKIEETVTVEGTLPRDGYRVEETTSLGPLGPARLLDTPYTLSVLSSELLSNGQVKNLKEASKYLPLVEFQEM